MRNWRVAPEVHTGGCAAIGSYGAGHRGSSYELTAFGSRPLLILEIETLRKHSQIGSPRCRAAKRLPICQAVDTWITISAGRALKPLQSQCAIAPQLCVTLPWECDHRSAL